MGQEDGDMGGMGYAENLEHEEDVHGYQYISISWAGSSPSGKTARYQVINNNSSDPLGEIRWWAQWRQYVFVPYPETIYSAGCLQDIRDFITALMLERHA